MHPKILLSPKYQFFYESIVEEVFESSISFKLRVEVWLKFTVAIQYKQRLQRK